MLLSKQYRIDIATKLIRTSIPVIYGAVIFTLVVILLFARGQYHRLLSVAAAVVAVIPTTLLAIKGKPLASAYFLIIGFCGVILSGMYFSGGVNAPIFSGILILTTLVVCLAGTKKAVIFSFVMIIFGAVFVFLEIRQILPPSTIPSPMFMLSIVSILLFMSLFFNAIPVNMLQNALNDKGRVEKELQSIINRTPDIIYRLDPEGRLTFINDAVKKYGYEPENLIGKSILHLVYPDDKAVVEKGMMERKSGEVGLRKIEVRLKAARPMIGQIQAPGSDEKYMTFQIASNDLYAKEPPTPDSYVGVQGIARDISITKHYEEQIGKLAAVVEQAAEDVVITDTKGVISYVNPRFEEVTGFSKSEAIGKTSRILKSGRHDKAFYDDLWQTIKSGTTWKGRIWNKIKNGSLILQDVTITPIFDTSQKLTGYVSIRRDITEQNRVEERLRQAQKMEAVGTLAGGIAHDFNNILSAMIGYSELVLEDIEKIPSARKNIEQVLLAGERAADLIRQILSFSSSRRHEAKPVSPNKIAKEVLKLMRATLPSNIKIEQSLNSESYVLADPTNIHQILMNLCSNSGYAMRDKGGRLTVSLEDVYLSEGDITQYVELSAGDYLKMTVEDTGQGIPGDVQKKVFDPFFTTKPFGQGSGMGLSVVHGIVKELDGAVALHSEAGKGTAVNVFLPVLTELHTAERHIKKEPLAGGDERILLVDDEEPIVKLERTILERLGYKVTSFTNSAEALEAFRADPDGFDLVVTDMTMPNKTGDQLAKDLIMINPDIRIILCTGFSAIIDEEKARIRGIKDFLMKPISSAALAKVVRKVLNET